MDILKSSAQALLVSCMVQVACYILNMVLYPGVGEEKKKVLKYATMASNAGILGNPVAEGIFGSMGLFYASLPDSAENCDVVAGNDVFYEGAGSEDAD